VLVVSVFGIIVAKKTQRSGEGEIAKEEGKEQRGERAGGSEVGKAGG